MGMFVGGLAECLMTVQIPIFDLFPLCSLNRRDFVLDFILDFVRER